jgi:hypothetical protein
MANISYLPIELSNRISSMLAACDLYCWSRTSKHYYKQFNSQILPAFKTCLSGLFAARHFDLHMFNFSDCPTQNGCVLTGSIVLQALLGESWPNSDIDIFVTHSQAAYARSKLIQAECVFNFFTSPDEGVYPGIDGINGQSNVRIDHREQYVSAHEHFTQHPFPPNRIIRRLQDIRTLHGEPMMMVQEELYTKKTKVVDFVVGVDNVTQATDLLDWFDLSVVMNSFDGKTLWVKMPHLTFTRQAMHDAFRAKQLQNLLQLSHENNARYVTKESVQAIISTWFQDYPHVPFPSRTLERREIRRLCKYEDRGFQLLDVPPIVRAEITKIRNNTPPCLLEQHYPQVFS